MAETSSQQATISPQLSIDMAIEKGDYKLVEQTFHDSVTIYKDGEDERLLSLAANSPEIQQFLSHQFAKEKRSRQAKEELFANLKASLPQKQEDVLELAIDTLLNYNVFKDRTKESLNQLLEDKHNLLSRCRTYEKSMGLLTEGTDMSFVSQLQYWQDEYEKQSNQITQLKHQYSLLKTSAEEKELFLNECLLHQKLEIESLRKQLNQMPILPNGDEVEVNGISSSKELAAEPIETKQSDQALGNPEKSESSDLITIKSETGQNVVKSGTVPALLDRLVDPNIHDTQFMQTLLMTKHIYIPNSDLLTFISSKYLKQENGEVKGVPHILKAINVTKYWIEQYWSDFEDDEILKKQLHSVIDKIENPKYAQMLRTAMSKKSQPVRESVLLETPDYPKPILPKQLQNKTKIGKSGLSSAKSEESLNTNPPYKIKFADLDPLEIARQLTLIEFDLFSKIKPREFVGLSWMKTDKETCAPNIIAMIRWSNHVIQWLVSEIVSVKDNLKQRAAVMEKVIMIAKNLDSMNNLNGVKEVLASLQSSSVYRLRKTKEAMNMKTLKTLEGLKTLTSTDMNFKNLRTRTHNVEPPLIPFPGVYQGDLVFLETIGKDILNDGMVNFLKFQKVAGYIIELQTYQTVKYQITPVYEIQDMIKTYEPLDEDAAYELSLYCEPRG